VRFLVVLLALVALFLLPHMASAQGLVPPCCFYGAVQLDGASVPDNIVITAVIDGDTYTVTTPARHLDGSLMYGPSSYALKIVPPEGTFYNDGTKITFGIGTRTANEMPTSETEVNIEVDLTASTSPPSTPTPTPTPTPPTTTPTPTPQETKTSLNMGRVIGLAIFSIVDAVLIGVLLYMAWRFFARRQG